MEADPHANIGYVIAAYVLVAVILGTYALVLWRKASRVTR